MAGFDNDNVYFSGIDTRGVKPVVNQMVADGQLLIGSTAAPNIRVSTLTAGTGIGIVNGAGSITISSSQAFTWTDVTTATQALAVANGYATDRGAGVVYTLPASAAFGDEIRIVGKLGLATITPNANQQILMAAVSGTVGVTGTAVATNVGDCIHLRCTTAGASTVWRAEGYVGNWTLN